MSFFSSHISSSSKFFYFTRGVASAIAGLPESPEYALLHTHGIVAAPFFAFCRWKGRHDTSIFLLNVSTHPLPSPPNLPGCSQFSISLQLSLVDCMMILDYVYARCNLLVHTVTKTIGLRGEPLPQHTDPP